MVSPWGFAQGFSLGFSLIDWACMPKAPRRAVDHALRPTPEQRLARGDIEHMRGGLEVARQI
jgi:hypothetical protein